MEKEKKEIESNDITLSIALSIVLLTIFSPSFAALSASATQTLPDESLFEVSSKIYWTPIFIVHSPYGTGDPGNEDDPALGMTTVSATTGTYRYYKSSYESSGTYKGETLDSGISGGTTTFASTFNTQAATFKAVNGAVRGMFTKVRWTFYEVFYGGIWWPGLYAFPDLIYPETASLEFAPSGTKNQYGLPDSKSYAGIPSVDVDLDWTTPIDYTYDTPGGGYSIGRSTTQTSGYIGKTSLRLGVTVEGVGVSVGVSETIEQYTSIHLERTYKFAECTTPDYSYSYLVHMFSYDFAWAFCCSEVYDGGGGGGGGGGGDLPPDGGV